MILLLFMIIITKTKKYIQRLLFLGETNMTQLYNDTTPLYFRGGENINATMKYIANKLNFTSPKIVMISGGFNLIT